MVAILQGGFTCKLRSSTFCEFNFVFAEMAAFWWQDQGTAQQEYLQCKHLEDDDKKLKILYPAHNDSLQRFQVQSSRSVPSIAAFIVLDEALA